MSRLLDDSPCFVLFSGGCDSSLILAAATAACRGTGHADPVAVTYRYSSVPAADERRYQELMVERLGLGEWIVVDLDDDGDLLGEPATAALREHGLVWPPAVLAHTAVLDRLDPGLVLSGEGGDEVFGPRRVTPVLEEGMRVRHGGRPSRAAARAVRYVVAPRAWRARQARAGVSRAYAPDWLAPELRDDLVRRLGALDALEPLRPSRYFDYSMSLPWVWIGRRNVRAVHARFGLRWEAPLYDPTVHGALAGSVRWHEYRGRVTILRRHFAELLPAEIVERRTKGFYNAAYLGASTREFARRWTGRGLPEGVDAEWLKEHWTSAEQIHAGTSLLLHQAWLATEGDA